MNKLGSVRHSVDSEISTQRSSRNPRQVYQHAVHGVQSGIGCAVPYKTIIVHLYLL